MKKGQTYSSAATSINHGKMPAVFGKMPAQPRGRLLFDYGSGRYTDHIEAALPGVRYLPFDPYNQPAEVNSVSLYFLRLARYVHMPVTIVCSNVLNVIDSEDVIRGIAGTIRAAVADTGGVAYITVWEGDKSGTGRRTGPDQWQRNEPLRDYLRFFPGAVIRRGMIVVEGGAA